MHENRLEMTMSTILRSILSVSGVNIPLTVVTAWSLRQRGKGTGTLRWGETWEEEEEELLRSARRLTGIRGLSVNNREVTFGPHDDTVLTSHPLLCSSLLCSACVSHSDAAAARVQFSTRLRHLKKKRFDFKDNKNNKAKWPTLGDDITDLQRTSGDQALTMGLE